MPTLDEGINRDVVNQLNWDSRVDASKVTVEVTGGSVQLKGMVPSQAACQAAEEDTWVVEGVSNVENQLMVAPSPVPVRASDEHIRVSIAQANRRNANLDEDRNDVSVDADIMTLEGTVDLFWKKGLAEDIDGPKSPALENGGPKWRLSGGF